MPGPGLTFVSATDKGWYIALRVQPGAKKSELAEVCEDSLRVRLAAPAVENKANKAIINFIAGKLKIKRNKITLVSGEKSRQKRLFIDSSAEPDWSGLMIETDNSVK